MDVRSDASVKEFVDTVLKQASRVDILINNAGYVLSGALEETTLEEAKSQFETNFFGVVRLVNAILPIMRKQGNGQIINVSSSVGLVPIPFWGFYSASKFAVEGYTEALHHEVKPFNIKVSLVEPGFIKTNLAHSGQLSANAIGDYDTWRQRTFDAIQQSMENAPEPIIVAETVEHIIKTESPKLRYRVGKDANLVARLRRFAPESMFEKIWRKNFHLNIS